MSREALVLLVCCCDFRDGAERLIPSKSLRNAVIRAFPGLFCILRMCAPRRAAAVVRPRGREKSADRRRRILISRLLIIRAPVPRWKSPFPAYFKGFPVVSPLIPPYPAFLKYPVSPHYGMLLGLIGGIIMTKLATKRGYTSYIENTDTISRELLTGIIPKGKRGSIGEETIASITLEPLAWHLALIMIPTGLAHIITIYGSKALGIELPEFSIAFFVSLILYYVFQATKVNDSVDPKVINGFGNLISDYVVVFSLAMVQVDVIIKYAAPFLLLMLAFTVWMVVWFWFCGPHLIGKDWFERGLFNWGYATGTFATGFCLLRVVDPNNRSTALSDTAILTPFEHVVEITALSLGPVLLSTGAEWSYLGVVVVYGLLWVASIFFLKVWKRKVCKVSPTNPMYCPSEAQKDSQHSSCV